MTITVVNQKGGVGKTATTHALGSALALRGERVLLVDLDTQASLSVCCGIKPYEIKDNIHSVMCRSVSVERCILKTKTNNLHLVPSGIELATAELELSGRIGRENVLKKALSLVEDRYDYILIDCGPSLSLLTINALVACSHAIVPCSPDYLAYQGLNLLMDTVAQVRENLNRSLEVMGVILTMSDRRTLHCREVSDLIIGNYKVLGEVGASVRVKDAAIEGVSIVEYDPSHPIALAYKAIAISM